MFALEELLEGTLTDGKNRQNNNLTIVREIESNKSQDTQTPTLDCQADEESYHVKFPMDSQSPLTSIPLKRKGGLLNNKISKSYLESDEE